MWDKPEVTGYSSRLSARSAATLIFLIFYRHFESKIYMFQRRVQTLILE